MAKRRTTSTSKPARKPPGRRVIKASGMKRLKSGSFIGKASNAGVFTKKAPKSGQYIQVSRTARRKAPTKSSHGGGLVAQFLTTDGLGIVADNVATAFGLSKAQLAETIGVSPDTLQRFSRAFAPKTQTRLREMLEIVGRVADWAGGTDQAMAWYRAEPIPAFGDRTAEFLVKDDKASAVRGYLDRVAMGGFA
jgi:hypothetical protein